MANGLSGRLRPEEFEALTRALWDHESELRLITENDIIYDNDEELRGLSSPRTPATTGS